jgi:hypothetical protein
MTTLREAANMPRKPWDDFHLRDWSSHRWTAPRISTKSWGKWTAFYADEHPEPLNVVCTTQPLAKQAARPAIHPLPPYNNPDAPPFDSYSLARDRLRKENEYQQMRVTAISFPSRSRRCESTARFRVPRRPVDIVVPPKTATLTRPATRQPVDLATAIGPTRPPDHT